MWEGLYMDESSIKSIRNNMIITNIVILLLGVAFIAWPKESSEMLVMAIGIVLIAMAVFEVVVFLFAKNRGFTDVVSLIAGIIAALAGIWLLISPSWLVGFFGIIFGVIIIAVGLAHIHQAIFIIRHHRQIWWISLLVAVLAIALGVFVIINPFEFTNGLMIWIGIGMVIEAVFGFFNLPAMKHKDA